MNAFRQRMLLGRIRAAAGRLGVSASVVAWAALQTGCAGANAGAKSAESAPPPQQAGYPAGQAPAPPPPPSPASPSSLDARSAEPMPGTPSTAPAAPGGAARPRDPTLKREVEAAQRELELAGSDCAAACRALGSMERATARLCTLEESSCEDVRVRLRRARERVRASCGGCSGGPSVDPDAPIPSR